MQRVILLGASNLTLAFPLVLKNLPSTIGGPVELFAAHGHGRSYGTWSRALFRGLPGITECNLWQDLQHRSRSTGRTLALVTDVGNDLMYGHSVDLVSNWVDDCLTRLGDHDSEIVLTLPPMASVRKLSTWRFHLIRTLFFPGLKTSLPTMLQRAEELEQRLRELGEKHTAHVVEPADDWYGFDPIHIRRSRRHDAWERIFAGWSDVAETKSPKTRGSLRHLYRSLSLHPAERRLFGRRQTATQPAHQSDQTHVFVY